jgi:hypothetical protein
VNATQIIQEFSALGGTAEKHFSPENSPVDAMHLTAGAASVTIR